MLESNRTTVCQDRRRRAELRASEHLHGIDFVEVATATGPDQHRALDVFFLRKTTSTGRAHLTATLSALATEFSASHSSVSIVSSSGQRLPIESVSANGESLQIRSATPGGLGSFELALEHAALDPIYRRVAFVFRPECRAPGDCAGSDSCEAPSEPPPLLDYMARDYASFRQAIFDRLTLIAPQLTERHEADFGVSLLELLAYVGDRLSYQQDAIATEAFLETARHRTSVRRHAALVDYRMHEGSSARVAVRFTLSAGSGPLSLPSGAVCLTCLPRPANPVIVLSHYPPQDEEEARVFDDADAVFELPSIDSGTDPRAGAFGNPIIDDAKNEFPIYAWSGESCCLPVGTTAIDLEGAPPSSLQPGDLLVLEEATTQRCIVVRVVAIDAAQTDPLPSPARSLFRVHLHEGDALAEPFKVLEGDSRAFARGNVLLAEQGRQVIEHPLPLAGPRTRKFQIVPLAQGPLSYRAPLPALAPDDPPPSFRALQSSDPGPAVPWIEAGTASQSSELRFVPVQSLLDEGADSPAFVVELDNDDRAALRFGDGEYGLALPPEANLSVTYRIGRGLAGNVGAHTITRVALPGSPLRPSDASGPAPLSWALALASVDNPLPAWGGSDPEPLERVKKLAPHAFRDSIVRAVTEADYQTLAEQVPGVSHARARFGWTGSFHTVFVAIDPAGSFELSQELSERVRAKLSAAQLLRYDLEIVPPTYVPLEVAIDVCVARSAFRGQVEAELRRVLGSESAGRSRGFFHPDNFSFGQSVPSSALYAAVARVAGVEAARVTKLRRRGTTDPDLPSSGELALQAFEIARMQPFGAEVRQGTLTLNLTGGK